MPDVFDIREMINVHVITLIVMKAHMCACCLVCSAHRLSSGLWYTNEIFLYNNRLSFLHVHHIAENKV